MKILVLQLARLGDIYQTWPVLRALRRTYPQAEIHLLTRAKFAAAVDGVGVIDNHWQLDTRAIMEPMVADKADIGLSLQRLAILTDDLRACDFTEIINLSFSPFSSHLTREISGPLANVRGYTRFRDGYLSIPDDGSAYFYAQVGPGKPNRLHVTDLFAFVAGVELREEDWLPPATELTDDIIIHVGASDLRKTLSWPKWSQVLKGLLATHTGRIVLIGSAEEAEFAERIASVSGDKQVVNLVGRTSLTELFQLVAHARLLIGGDSGPVQIASLTGTKVLNISLPMVSFWETGPRAKGSRILPIADDGAIAAEEIVTEALAMIADRPSRLPIVRVPGRTFPYVETRPQPLAFEWELVRALYMGEAFPAPSSEIFLQGIQRLQEVNDLAIEQIEALRRNTGNKTANAILDRSDELMEQIANMIPETAPLVRWFQTERLRIGPMPVESLIEATEQTHARLTELLAIYTAGETENDDVAMG